MINDVLINSIKDIFKNNGNIFELRPKISCLKLTTCCVEYLKEETTLYLKRKAAELTTRRELVFNVTLLKMVLNYHRYESEMIYSEFMDIIRSVVEEEYLRQKDVFIRNNQKEISISNDNWKVFWLDGESLRYANYDFRALNVHGLRLELKYYYKNHLLFGNKVNCFVMVISALNYLTDINKSIKYFSDISEEDVSIICTYLKTMYLAKKRKTNLAPKSVANVIYCFQEIIKYLVCIERDKQLKTPIPIKNYFERYSFKNITKMQSATMAMPECVIFELDKHSNELSQRYKIIYDIFIATGLRAKEIMLLKEDCLEKSEFGECTYLRYIPYKTVKARRKRGLSDETKILIPNLLANSISTYIKENQEFRNENDTDFIFSVKSLGKKMSTPNSTTFVQLINQLIARHNICDEMRDLWHFSSRQFRKTIATILIENGASTTEVAYSLGHFCNNTAIKYYEDVRKMKLAQMNTDFFKAKFDVLVSSEQLVPFTEEQRKQIYVDFSLEKRRVELGYCLKPFDLETCTEKSREQLCVGCKNLCTGKKYLNYWERQKEQQVLLVSKLIQHYNDKNITEYMNFKEYQQENFLLKSYSNIVKKILEGDLK